MEKTVQRRTLALLLTFMLALSVGSTCIAAETELEPVDLVWNTIVGTEYASSTKDRVMADINAYLKEKINANLTMNMYLVADYSKNMATMVAAGTKMDILICGAGALSYDEYARMNALVALDDYLDEYMPATSKFLSESIWNSARIDGSIYCVPCFKDLAGRRNFQYNVEMLEEAGVDLNFEYHSSADILDICYQVKEYRNEAYPEQKETPILATASMIVDPLGLYALEYLVVDGYYASLMPSSVKNVGIKGYGPGQVFNYYETPEFAQNCRNVRDAVLNYIVPFDEQSFDVDRVLLQEGKLIGVVSLGEVFVDPQQNAPYYTTGFAVPDLSLLSTGYSRAGLQCISVQSDNVERALMLLDLVNSDEYLMTTLAFGQEGIDYTDLNNDRVVEFEGTLNEDPANRSWCYWYPWFFGNITAGKYMAGYPTNFGELIMDLNNNANVSDVIGFSLDTTTIQTEIAACNSVQTEYAGMLNKGQLDNIDELIVAFNEKLYANGLQTILDEAQRQIDAFLAAK